MTKKTLILPRLNYGPICLKILTEFAKHNNLPITLLMPEAKQATHQALARIFDILLLSMGEEKRNELLNDAEEYFNDLPPSVR
jgi:antitoxin component of RelBE/YafQ-DinJ toxin-antitoxin module